MGLTSPVSFPNATQSAGHSNSSYEQMLVSIKSTILSTCRGPRFLSTYTNAIFILQCLLEHYFLPSVPFQDLLEEHISDSRHTKQYFPLHHQPQSLQVPALAPQS